MKFFFFLKKCIFSFFSIVFCMQTYFWYFFKALRKYMELDYRLSTKLYYLIYPKFPRLWKFLYKGAETFSEDKYYLWTIFFGIVIGSMLAAIYCFILLPVSWKYIGTRLKFSFLSWFIKSWTIPILRKRRKWAFIWKRMSRWLSLRYLRDKNIKKLFIFSSLFTVLYIYLCKYSLRLKYYFLIFLFVLFFSVFLFSLSLILSLKAFHEGYYAYHLIITDSITHIKYVEPWLWEYFFIDMYSNFAIVFFYNYYFTQFILCFAAIFWIVACIELFLYFYNRLYKKAVVYGQQW